MIALAAACLFVSQASVEVGLSLADLPAYKAALEGQDRSPAEAVGFRSLWDRPATFQGRRVRIEGRIVRRFQTQASGELPARVEVWLATANNDVMCAVTPRQNANPGPKFGEQVAIVGTSLGLVRYPGGDVVRLAPLIVGDEPPKAIASESPGSGGIDARRGDWIFAAVASAFVVLFLVRARFRRPVTRRLDFGPPPEFEDGPDLPRNGFSPP